MFGLFKKSTNVPAEQRAALVAVGIEPALRRVNDLLLLGQTTDAKKLLESVVGACIRQLVGEPKYFDQVRLLGNFLIEQGELALATQLARAMGAHATKYTGKELEATHHWLNELHRALDVDAPSRETEPDVFYICQNCGTAIFRLTYPCDRCGFIPHDLDGVVKGVSLASLCMEPTSLMKIAKSIGTAKRSGKPAPSLVGAVPDDIAAECAARVANNLAGGRATTILELCRTHRSESHEPINDQLTCECGERNRVYAFADSQACTRCGSKLAAPLMQRYKVFLRDFVDWLITVVDVPTSLAYSNLIATLVKMKSDACFDGRRMTRTERDGIVARLVSIGSLRFCRDRCVMHFDGNAVSVGYLPEARHERLYDDMMGRTAAYFNQLYRFCKNGVIEV
jgi:hypothetical protein